MICLVFSLCGDKSKMLPHLTFLHFPCQTSVMFTLKGSSDSLYPVVFRGEQNVMVVVAWQSQTPAALTLSYTWTCLCDGAVIVGLSVSEVKKLVGNGTGTVVEKDQHGKNIYVLNSDWRFFDEIRWKWAFLFLSNHYIHSCSHRHTERERERHCRSCASWHRVFCCGTLGLVDGTGWHCKWTYLVGFLWNALVRFSCYFSDDTFYTFVHTFLQQKQVDLYNKY